MMTLKYGLIVLVVLGSLPLPMWESTSAAAEQSLQCIAGLTPARDNPEKPQPIKKLRQLCLNCTLVANNVLGELRRRRRVKKLTMPGGAQMANSSPIDLMI
jgi:hypothetical protein